MNRAGKAFAAITAELEDMHEVAVEGQHPELPPADGLALATRLRAGILRLGKLTVRVERSMEGK